jgi:hypothetical protein
MLYDWHAVPRGRPVAGEEQHGVEARAEGVDVDHLGLGEREREEHVRAAGAAARRGRVGGVPGVDHREGHVEVRRPRRGRWASRGGSRRSSGRRAPRSTPSRRRRRGRRRRSWRCRSAPRPRSRRPPRPLQSRKPLAAGAPRRHAPPLQAPAALGGRHARLQPPQWVSEPLVSVSQPLGRHAVAVAEARVAGEGAHAAAAAGDAVRRGAHRPAGPAVVDVGGHRGLAAVGDHPVAVLVARVAGRDGRRRPCCTPPSRWGREHALPQPPQFEVLVSSATSQPSAALRLQSP